MLQVNDGAAKVKPTENQNDGVCDEVKANAVLETISYHRDVTGASVVVYVAIEILIGSFFVGSLFWVTVGVEETAKSDGVIDFLSGFSSKMRFQVEGVNIHQYYVSILLTVGGELARRSRDVDRRVLTGERRFVRLRSADLLRDLERFLNSLFLGGERRGEWLRDRLLGLCLRFSCCSFRACSMS